MDKAQLSKDILNYQGMLYGYAMKLTNGNSHDSLDLVQDTFEKALANSEKFDGANLQAWLHTILRNQFINVYRKQSRMVVADETALVELETETAPSAEYRAIFNHFSPKVSQALQALGDDFLKVVYLVDIEGFTYEETANQLGVKTATVGTRLNRAHKVLREALA